MSQLKTLRDRDFYRELKDDEIIREGDQYVWGQQGVTIDRGSEFIGRPVSELKAEMPTQMYRKAEHD